MGGGSIVGGDGVLKAKSSKVIGERVIVMSMDELSLDLIKDEDVPLVDGVLDGALGAFGDLVCCCGDGVFESSLVRSMNNFLGGISVIFSFLEILEVKA
ncbi:hypothetical protein Tco_1064766 [Tanacetum coccineum]